MSERLTHQALWLVITGILLTRSINAQKDLNFTCRIPEGATASDVAYMQIWRSDGDLNKTVVLATAQWARTTLAAWFAPTAPAAEVAGSIEMGLMELRIPNTTGLGVYFCITGYYSNDGRPDSVRRVLSVASESIGPLFSQPPGFKVHIEDSGCAQCGNNDQKSDDMSNCSDSKSPPNEIQGAWDKPLHVGLLVGLGLPLILSAVANALLIYKLHGSRRENKPENVREEESDLLTQGIVILRTAASPADGYQPGAQSNQAPKPAFLCREENDHSTRV